MKQARKYAKMFLNSVKDAEKALEELAVLSALKEKSFDFQSVLENPVFTRDERSKAIEAACTKAGISENTQKFIKFLTAEGAASGLAEILDKAVTLYRERNNRVKATIISPVQVDAVAAQRIKTALAGITGKEVEIDTEQDPTLIGGILVKVGSRMFDASIKGQLRLLKEELIKG
jgi:ATP synthase F1 delta subunit